MPIILCSHTQLLIFFILTCLFHGFSLSQWPKDEYWWNTQFEKRFFPFQSVLLYFTSGVVAAPGFFMINRTTGAVTVASDLRFGEQMQYMVSNDKFCIDLC